MCVLTLIGSLKLKTTQTADSFLCSAFCQTGCTVATFAECRLIFGFSYFFNLLENFYVLSEFRKIPLNPVDFVKMLSSKLAYLILTCSLIL